VPATPRARGPQIVRRLDGTGVSWSAVTRGNEFVSALVQSGYRTIYIGSPGYSNYLGHFEFAYNTDFGDTLVKPHEPTLFYQVRFGSMGSLVSMATPIQLLNRIFPYNYTTYYFPMFNDLPHYITDQSQRIYRALIDSSGNQDPKFTLILFNHTHPSGLYWWADLKDDDMGYSDIYPYAYAYALEIMLNAIDLILSINPNAVIVLQADHGIHTASMQEEMYNRGRTVDELLELFNSVFSAVRIPEQYGGLDAPLDPRNISRVLINRFIGENYELRP